MYYDYDDDDYYYRLLRERRHYWYDRDRRYWDWPYYPVYGGNYGGQYSSVNQGLYNSGYMSNSGQSSIVNQI